MSDRKKRRAEPVRLAFLLFAAPFVAGMVGWAVFSVILIVVTRPPFAELSEFGYIASFSSIYALYFGTPVILATWAVSHFAGWRSPRAMMIAGCGGGIVAASLASGWIAPFGLPILAPAIAISAATGALVGAMISIGGYRAP